MPNATGQEREPLYAIPGPRVHGRAPLCKHSGEALVELAVEARIIANAKPEAVKTCTSCWERRLLEEFRLRSRQTGQRRHECRACWNKYIRQYRARQREAALTRFIRALAAASNVGRISAVAQDLMRRFGGVRRSAEALHHRAATLATAKPGQRQTLQTLSAIARLVWAAS